MLKERVGEVGDRRRAVHDADLADLDQLRRGKIAVRAVGQEGRHRTSPHLVHLQPRIFFSSLSARKEGENSPLVLR